MKDQIYLNYVGRFVYSFRNSSHKPNKGEHKPDGKKYFPINGKVKKFEVSIEENLFRKKSHHLFILEGQIKDEIKKYKSRFSDSESYFIKKFPDQMNIESWLVTLKKNGFQGSHIHAEGWLSGVFYIDLPPNKKSNEGAIKFCLHGFDYRMKKNATKEKIINPKKYDIVLFPSSLFHETLPFSSNQKRLCIAFDLSPREDLRTKF